jgi:cytidylate kinase
MNKITIAIDGHSACGKSTTAKAVAKALNYTYVDSGAMYRAVTYYVLEHSIDINDLEVLSKALDEISIEFRLDKDNHPSTWLNGQNIEEEIRTMRVSGKVSEVAAISEVRQAMVRLQQQMGEHKGIVMDGRDIGTVVFPEAELKIFMTASSEVRAQRRLKELEQKGIKSSLEDVMANLVERDHIDTTREDSPLIKANDAIVVDNSNLTFDQQVERILILARTKIDA